MIKIRPASKNDEKAILKILEEADLHYKDEKLDNFLAAEIDGKVAGIVRIEEHADFLFLTSLGVASNQRNKGIATALLNHIFRQAEKPIYIYTIIPEFFEKFGFKVTKTHPSLPPKNIFGCEECFPNRCVIMVKT